MNNYDYTKILVTSIIASAFYLKVDADMASLLTPSGMMEQCIEEASEQCDKIFDKVRKESGE